MEQRLMAFWKSGSYPYVLWGEVTEFTPKGKVKIKEYGNGIFTPIAIYPHDEGKTLAKRFRDLEMDYLNEVSEVHRVYRERLRNESPFIIHQ